MNKVTLFTIFVLITIVANAQETYFHELRGMEDSTETSHLFYRVYESIQTTCFDGEYEYTLQLYSNNIFHYSTSIDSVELYLKDGKGFRPKCEPEINEIPTFINLSNNPDSAIAIRGTFGGLYGGYTIGQEFGHNIYIGYQNPLGFFYDRYSDAFVVTTPVIDVVVKATQSDNHLKQSFIYDPKDPIWDDISDYTQIPDSLFIDISILGTSSFDGTYYGASDSNFVFTQDYGKTIIDYFGTEFYLNEGTIIGKQNSSNLTFELRNKNTNELRLLTLDEWNGGKSWGITDLAKNYNFSVYSLHGDNLYFSRKDTLFLTTTNYAYQNQDAEFVHIFSDEITGLYLKPDSDTLYVLTKEELFLYLISVESYSSILTLPVSNETEPEIPTQLLLHQNYPNPFNPSTVISYQLPASSLVTLKVYDLLGREIAELLNAPQPAGTHQITFDATSLSSGTYLYRIEANGAIQTKRFTLIK